MPICLFVVATRVQPSLRDDIEHVRVRVRVYASALIAKGRGEKKKKKREFERNAGSRGSG